MSRVVVITGASAGVGRATANRFAKDGASIGLIARGKAGLEGCAREIEQQGARALVIPCDVADPQQVEEAADRIERRLGPIDVWINCAMVTVFGELKDLSPEEFRRVTEVTYLGYVWGTMAALRRMRSRDRGVIVQVGSALAYRGIPLQSAYCGAKHAIRGFTESLRTELMHHRSSVRVSMVQMPALNTPQFEWCRNKMSHKSQPVPPIYQPEVAAEGIHFVTEHDRRELFVGGSTAIVIEGEKVGAGLGDWVLARTGYESQQYDGSPDSDRDNLFAPADESRDFGMHGKFSTRAKKRSFELWMAEHKLKLLGALAAAAALVGFVRKSL
jgi:NAD(P)-dependent dehydrogenase (short-subunit alcohol dehydrogenase family)